MFTRNLATKLAFMAICGALFWTAGCSPKTETEAPVEEAASTETTMSEELTDTQKIHRTLGYFIGMDLLLESYSEDEITQILAGLEAASKGEKPEFADELQEKAFHVHSDKRNRQANEQRDGELASNKAAGAAFLAKMDQEEGVIKTESGLRYKVLKEGSDKFATRADSVKVHYHGTLIDGTVFDSSVDRNEPIDFPLGGVVPGFSEGLTLIGEGGKIALYMPSDLAYGDAGRGGPIGPGVTLIFEVELLKINP